METNDKKRIDKVRSNYSGIYTTFIQLQWCNKRMWEQQACVGAISSCRCNNLLSLEQIHVGAISFFRCNKLTWVQQAPFCASIARSHSTPRLLQRCSTTLPHVSFACRRSKCQGSSWRRGERRSRAAAQDWRSRRIRSIRVLCRRIRVLCHRPP